MGCGASLPSRNRRRTLDGVVLGRSSLGAVVESGSEPSVSGKMSVSGKTSGSGKMSGSGKLGASQSSRGDVVTAESASTPRRRVVMVVDEDVDSGDRSSLPSKQHSHVTSRTGTDADQLAATLCELDFRCPTGTQSECTSPRRLLSIPSSGAGSVMGDGFGQDGVLVIQASRVREGRLEGSIGSRGRQILAEEARPMTSPGAPSEEGPLKLPASPSTFGRPSAVSPGPHLIPAIPALSHPLLHANHEGRGPILTPKPPTSPGNSPSYTRPAPPGDMPGLRPIEIARRPTGGMEDNASLQRRTPPLTPQAMAYNPPLNNPPFPNPPSTPQLCLTPKMPPSPPLGDQAERGDFTRPRPETSCPLVARLPLLPPTTSSPCSVVSPMGERENTMPLDKAIGEREHTMPASAVGPEGVDADTDGEDSVDSQSSNSTSTSTVTGSLTSPSKRREMRRKERQRIRSPRQHTDTSLVRGSDGNESDDSMSDSRMAPTATYSSFKRKRRHARRQEGKRGQRVNNKDPEQRQEGQEPQSQTAQEGPTPLEVPQKSEPKMAPISGSPGVRALSPISGSPGVRTKDGFPGVRESGSPCSPSPAIQRLQSTSSKPSDGQSAHSPDGSPAPPSPAFPRMYSTSSRGLSDRQTSEISEDGLYKRDSSRSFRDFKDEVIASASNIPLRRRKNMGSTVVKANPDLSRYGRQGSGGGFSRQPSGRGRPGQALEDIGRQGSGRAAAVIPHPPAEGWED
eukprot:Hpha_TRINITY_DN15947_c0_g8::TRINITY_DN15947_c0_g8_i1::g.74975::m.74975